MNEQKTRDMKPNEIRAQLALHEVTQSSIARRLNVRPSAISRVIDGTGVSDRIRRAIANAVQMDVVEIWPSAYGNGGPRSPGRPIALSSRTGQSVNI